MSGSTSTSAAPTQTSQKTGPSAYEPVPSGATSPRPISSPPARPKCWTNSAGEVAGVDLVAVPAISTSFAPHVRRRALHGEARDRRRAARAGRAVVRREPRVGAAHRHPLGRRRELLGRDLRVRGARALAELGRADEHGHLAVRLHPHDRRRDRVGAGGEQADRDAAADVRLLRLAPADGRARPSRRRRRGRRRAACRRRAPPRRGRTGSPGARRAGRARRGARARRSATRRSTAGGSRRTRDTSPTARCSCRRRRRRRGRPPSGTGRAPRRRRSPSRAARCRRRRPCRTSTRRRGRAAAPRCVIAVRMRAACRGGAS